MLAGRGIQATLVWNAPYTMANSELSALRCWIQLSRFIMFVNTVNYEDATKLIDHLMLLYCLVRHAPDLDTQCKFYKLGSQFSSISNCCNEINTEQKCQPFADTQEFYRFRQKLFLHNK